jgi:hypothetical protein
MQELVYISEATKAFSTSELSELLSTARKNNALMDITGILLFDQEKHFLQVLEGPEGNIQALLSKIKADPRNTDVLVVHVCNISHRTFNDWSMALKEVDSKRLNSFKDKHLLGEVISEVPNGLVGELINRFCLDEYTKGER